MKTSDFRIGNIIQIPRWGGYREITSLSESTFQASSQSIHISKIIPIPLTKELLTDWLGFEEAINKTDCYVLPVPPFYETLQFGIDYKEGSDVIVVAKGSMGWAVTGKYLHQLQNLYFALTGTELEIKIPAKA